MFTNGLPSCVRRGTLLALSFTALSACASQKSAAGAPAAKASSPRRERAEMGAPQALAPQGIHVARRCYCLARKGATAEFGLRLSADESTERGVSIRVFPGASRDAILVRAPVVLHSKYEYVKFQIPALPGVEDFQLELNAKVREQAIGQVVTERCEQSCTN
jgi:hypothetical protein